MPGTTKPGEAAGYLAAEELAGLMIDITADHVTGLDEYWKITEGMAEEIGKKTPSEFWTAWIEVYDFNDVNRNGKIDDGEKYYYWIEVGGIGAYLDDDDKDSYDRNAYLNGSGYHTAAQAISAAGTALDWAWRTGGKIPEEELPYMEGQSNEEYVGQTYITSNPIVADLEFVEDVKTTREWINRARWIYNKLRTASE